MIRQAPDTDRGTDWRDLGLCAIHPEPDLWFPLGDTPRYADQVEQAKRICRTCPVAWQCAAWALQQEEPHGVWGGLSEADRRAIQRRHHRHTRQETAA